MTWNPSDAAPELASLDQGNTWIPRIRRFFKKLFCGISLSRTLNFGLFACVCIGSLLAQVAPVMVALLDVVSMLILYMVCDTGSGSEYQFNTSLLDILLLSVLRSVCNVAAYLGCGTRQNCHKPYLYSAFATGALSLGFLFFKVVEYSYADASANETWAAVLMFLISAICAVAHILCAQPIHATARKRRKAQLSVSRYAPSEQDWLVDHASHPQGYSSMGTKDGSGSSPGGGRKGGGRRSVSDSDSDDESPDLPAKHYADRDSRFLICQGVELHYKLVYPPEPSQHHDCQTEEPSSPPQHPRAFDALILLHGFGGGVHSWRLVAAPLAAKCGVPVLSLDRPGFGLSARPLRHDFQAEDNPYAMQSQVQMVLSMCRQLGFARVVLAGHADGALLALLTAAAATNYFQLDAPSTSSSVQLPRISVAGVCLLAPVLTTQDAVPTSTRLLLQTRLGRHMLRPLLRSEIGDVALRRAWHDPSKLRKDTLDLYRRPLRTEGWDRALYEVARLKGEVDTVGSTRICSQVSGLPTMVLSGENDRVVSTSRSEAVASKFSGSLFRVIRSCGHLPHEESPSAVVSFLSDFVAEVLPSLQDTTGASTSGITLVS
mmetsp:Transcript_18536/g.25689  ORF Transcript_18536/g.25689 Transcript_18536/m.25689 type:complete len:603 (-) Transcript_18536:15-1823(-)